MTEMTTNTLYGNNCGCAPTQGNAQSSIEIGIDICCEKTQGFFHNLGMAIKRPLVGLFSFDAAVGGSWITSSPDKACEDYNLFQSRREETRTRWMSLATANLSAGDVPAADLVDLESRYLVRSEDYRISVAQGQPYIDAEVMRMHNQKMWF
jgi:hypothetical protein